MIAMTEYQEIILYYQLFIFIAVVSRAFYGQQALNRTTLIVFLWTLTHFIIPWLMALQFLTIVMAYFLGRMLARTA
ncbi:hypothetical protein CCP3SC1AL1_100007 [Gammaproteobacteria bacterium]